MADGGKAEQTEFPRVLILGPVAIETIDGTTALRGQQGDVVALLAAAYPRAVTVDTLADHLWPHGAPASARTGLAVVIHRLRQRLGADVESIVNEGESYRLTVAPASLDHERFTGLVAAADEQRTTNPARTLALVEEALALWRGQAFQHIDLRGDVRSRATALDTERLDLQEVMAQLLLELDRPQDAALWATRLIEDDPYRERRWELLILALYRCGRQAEALRAAHDARQRLRDDLGIAVGPALAQLEHNVLTQSPNLDLGRVEPTGMATNVDTVLGTSSSDTSTRDDAIDGAAFLSAPSPEWGPPPQTPGPFVGRQDLEDGIEAIMRSAHLVTVTGPMGVGKSRLTSRHVATLTDHRTCWFDARDTSAAELIPALAARLQVRPSNGDLTPLVDTLGTAPTVLVIDNADLITDEVARLAEQLLALCPTLRILVTSRRPLGAPSERLLPVSPLLPREGVELLLSLAPGTDSDDGVDAGIMHEALTELVDRVDGLPLGIELLAPALTTFTPSQLRNDVDQILRNAARTGSVDERHASLDDAYAWSLQRQPSAVQDLFAELGVFTGAFGVDDVIALTGRTYEQTHRDLDVLRDHRLIELDHLAPRIRFRLLNSARVFARDQWTAESRSRLQRHHAEHHVALLHDIAPQLADQNEAAAASRLQEVDGELTATLRWLKATGERHNDPAEARRAASFALALWEHDFLRQRFDRYDWIEQILHSHSALPELDIYPAVLGGAALSAWAQNRFEVGLRFAAQAEAAAVDRSQPVPLAAIKARFNTAVHLGRMDDGLTLIQQLLSESKDQSQPRHHADTLVIVTMGQAQLGMPEAAETAEHALSLMQETGNPTSISWAQVAVGSAQMLSDKRAAARTFNAAARTARSVSNVFVEGMALTGLATALRHLGRTTQVQPVLLGVLDLWHRSQATPQVHRCASEAALLLLSTDDRDGAARVLAALDLVDRTHPMLPEDQARLDQAIATLDLDQPLDFDPIEGAPDPTRLVVQAVRQALAAPRS